MSAYLLDIGSHMVFWTYWLLVTKFFDIAHMRSVAYVSCCWLSDYLYKQSTDLWRVNFSDHVETKSFSLTVSFEKFTLIQNVGIQTK